MTEMTSLPGPKPTPEVAYGTIAAIVISEAHKFLEWTILQLKMQPKDGLQPEFVLNFLLQADGFSNRCCSRLAATLQASSRIAEVRETTEPVLRHLVRNRCFEALDAVLVRYLEPLKLLNLELGSVVGHMGDSIVRETASMLLQAARLPVKPSAQSRNPLKAKASLVVLVWKYIGHLPELGPLMVDYGATKLFGAEIDDELQKAAVKNIQTEVREDWNQAIARLEKFRAVQERKWNELRVAEEERIQAATLDATQRKRQGRTGVMSVFWGLVAHFPRCSSPPWARRTASRWLSALLADCSVSFSCAGAPRACRRRDPFAGGGADSPPRDGLVRQAPQAHCAIRCTLKLSVVSGSFRWKSHGQSRQRWHSSWN